MLHVLSMNCRVQCIGLDFHPTRRAKESRTSLKSCNSRYAACNTVPWTSVSPAGSLLATFRPVFFSNPLPLKVRSPSTRLSLYSANSQNFPSILSTPLISQHTVSSQHSLSSSHLTHPSTALRSVLAGGAGSAAFRLAGRSNRHTGSSPPSPPLTYLCFLLSVHTSRYRRGPPLCASNRLERASSLASRSLSGCRRWTPSPMGSVMVLRTGRIEPESLSYRACVVRTPKIRCGAAGLPEPCGYGKEQLLRDARAHRMWGQRLHSIGGCQGAGYI
jgi:hypothetical protein